MALTTIKTGGLADNSVTDAKVADAITVTGAQTGITQVGTLTAGTWQGTKVASAYLDDDTAHLSGTQTFSGAKTFTSSPLLLSASSARFSISRTSTSGNADLSFRTNNSETDGCWTLRMGSDTTPDLSFNRWTDGSADTAIMTLNHDGSSTFAGDVTIGNDLKSSGTGRFIIEPTSGTSDFEALRIKNDTHQAYISLYRGGTERGRISTNSNALYLQARNGGSAKLLDDGGNGLSIADGGNATFAEDINLAVGKLVNFGDTSGTTDRMLIRKNDDSSGEINVLSSNDLILRTADTTRLTIKANGDTQFGDSNGTGDIYHYGAYKFLINDVASSAAAPTYSFNSDPDTGMYRSGTDEIGLATAGVHRMSIQANGTSTLFMGAAAAQFAEYESGGIIWLDGVNGDLSGGDYWGLQAVNGGGSFRIKRAGSTKVIVDSSGNMEISGSLTENSDIRLKENIEAIPNALSKVNQMRGVHFNKKGSDKKLVGMIADEVEKIIPELVTTATEKGELDTEALDNLKSLRYSNMVAVLVEAVKELSAEVEALKNG